MISSVKIGLPKKKFIFKNYGYNHCKETKFRNNYLELAYQMFYLNQQNGNPQCLHKCIKKFVGQNNIGEFQKTRNLQEIKKVQDFDT